jgi:hypothetical protein
MMHRRLFPIVLLGLAGVLHAQPGVVMESPPLPLRNVLIEVRQDDGQSGERERLGAGINARVQPGRSEAEISIEAQSRRFERSGSAQQQVLVLNGRPAAIMLGNSVPLRLRQIITSNGLRRLVPGTVWLQAGTGFTATPVWEGGEMLYLQLAATQGRQVGGPTASTSTTLMLPLDEWTTVAESDETLDNQQNAQGLAGAGRELRSGSTRLRVQVRVSVR